MPGYRVDGKIYDIPVMLQDAFEKDNPHAEIEVEGTDGVQYVPLKDYGIYNRKKSSPKPTTVAQATEKKTATEAQPIDDRGYVFSAEDIDKVADVGEPEKEKVTMYSPTAGVPFVMATGGQTYKQHESPADWDVVTPGYKTLSQGVEERKQSARGHANDAKRVQEAMGFPTDVQAPYKAEYKPMDWRKMESEQNQQAQPLSPVRPIASDMASVIGEEQSDYAGLEKRRALDWEEDAEVDKNYKPRDIDSAADVYANYRDRFALTKEGKQAETEINDIQSALVDKYSMEFATTPEYKAIMDTYDGTEASLVKVNKAMNDTFLEMYADMINEELAPYMEEYQNRINTRYADRIRKDMQEVARKENASTVNKLYQEVRDLQKEVGGHSYVSSPSTHAPIKVSGGSDAEALLQAEKLLQDSRNVIEEATTHKDSGFVSGVGRGVRDNLSPEDFTFGISDLADEKRLNNILGRYEKGEKVSDAEMKLLEASAANMVTHAYYDMMLSSGYKAGQVTAESLPFMLEFVANPIAGSGKALAKGLLKVALKKFGSKAINAGTKFGARLIGDALAAGGMTLTSGLAGVEAEATRRMNEGYDYGMRDGKLYVEHKPDAISWGEARGKAFAQRAIENQSEMVFNAFSGVSKVLGGKGSILNKLSESKGGKFIKDAFNNKYIKEIAESTQFHGLPVEYMEEVYNNGANVLLGEMSVEDFADVDKNIETFLGLAPTSVVFGLLGLGGMAIDKVSNRRELNRIYNSLPDDLREQYNRVMQSKGYDAESTKEFVKSVITNPRATEEKKAAAIRLGYCTVADMTYEDAEQAEQSGDVPVTPGNNNEDDVTEGTEGVPVISNLETAKINGRSLYEEHDMGKMRQAYLRALYAMSRLRNVAGEDVVTMIDEARSEDDIERIIASLPEDQRRYAADYAVQSKTMDAIDEAIDTHYGDDEVLTNRVVDEVFMSGNKTSVPIVRLDDKTAIVVLNGMTADGALEDAGGRVMGVSVPLVNGAPDWRIFDANGARAYQVKSEDIISMPTQRDVVEFMLADKFAEEGTIFNSSPISVGATFPVLLDGEVRDVSVVGQDRGNWLVEVIGEKGIESVTNEELEQWKHDAELFPIVQEYAEIDNSINYGERIGEEVRPERNEAHDTVGISAGSQTAHEVGVHQGPTAGVDETTGGRRTRSENSGREGSVQGVVAEVPGDGIKESALSRLAVYPEGHAKAGRPDYESSRVEDVRDYLLESLGEEKALKTVDNTISANESRLKEKQDYADRFVVEMENSALEVDDMLRAQEQLKAVESEVATLQKSVDYWKEVRTALGGEIGRTPSLIDVVRTLYTKGKDVASKLFQRSFFDVAQTPKFMHELGLRGDKFTIKYGVIARHLGKDSSHTLTVRDWEQLPQSLQNPFAISKLTDKEDSYRIYTTLLTESGEFVVVGADVKNAGREIEVNAVSTVFGRRNNANLPKNEEVIYKSNEITPEQLSLLERPNFAQYPTEQELSSKDVPSANKDNVGLSDMQEKVEESLPPLDKKIQRRINAAQTREKNRLSAPKEWSEMTKAKTKYNSYPAIMDVLNLTEPSNGNEYAAMWLASNKITPESFRAETGYGLNEQKSFVGMIERAENGGVSIEHAAELLAQDDEYNYFGGDDYNARNALIHVLGEVSSRGDLLHYIDNRRIAEADRMYERELEDEREYLNEITMRDYEMSVDEYEADRELWNDYMDEVIEERLSGWENFRDSEAYFDLFDIFALESKTEENGREDTRNVLDGREKGIRDDIGNESAGVRESGSSLQGQGIGARTAIAEGNEPRDSGGGPERGGTFEPSNPVEPSVSSGNVAFESGGEESRLSDKIASAESDVDTSPTEAQKKAGNYKKGHVQIGSFNVTIEQPKGSVRSGVDKDGKKWETTMQNTYGYIRGTEGVDGDHIDVFLSNDIDGWDGRKVFVVDQYNPDGSFDEHKVMLGFNDIDDAYAAYLSNYEKGWSDSRKIVIRPSTLEDFEKWINSSHRKTKPFAEYKSVEENRRKPLRERVAEWANKLGIDIVVLENLDEVTNSQAREAIASGDGRYPGWYGEKSGKVYIYLPHVTDVKDIDETVVHEVVAHKGLRRLMGEKFDALCDMVWNSMSKENREKFMSYPGVNGNHRAAADEYMAYIAEKTELTEEEQGIWDKIVQFVKDLITLNLGVKLSDAQIAGLIRASYAEMKREAGKQKEAEATDVTTHDTKNTGRERHDELIMIAAEAHKAMGERQEAYSPQLPKPRDLVAAYEKNDSKEITTWKKQFEDVLSKMVPLDIPMIEQTKDNALYIRNAQKHNKDSAHYKAYNDIVKMLRKQKSKLESQLTDSDRDVLNAIAYSRGEGTRFRFAKSPQEFDATQKEAVEKRGIVMSGLRNVAFNVVDVPRHDFTGRGIDAIHKAKKWANENIAKEHTYHKGREDEFKYVIDEEAIGKFLSKSSTGNSDNLGVHLAVLKSLPEVIDNSIDVEIHPDYQKKDGLRSPENGVGRSDLLVHRMYGAVSIDDKVYRAKTTIHEFRDKENKAYDYKITEVKLIVSGSSTSNARTNLTSVDGAKLLDGVEKSYDNGKKVLDESVDLTKDTVSDSKYGAIEHRVMFRSSPLMKGLRELEDGETCDVERIFTENKYFEFSGVNKIKSYSDVAYIFKQLEDESVENAFAVLVKRGKPTVIHLGMGHYTQSMVNKSVLNVAVTRMNPDKIYFVHNHPSGQLKASAQDVRMLQSLQEAYGSKMADGIIINTRSGQYGVFNEESYTTKVDAQTGLSDTSEAKPLKVYTFSKQVFSKDYQPGRSLLSSEDVARFVSSHRLGDRKKLGLIISNNNGITGNIFLPYTDINKDNARSIASDIIYYTSVMGGTHAVMFGNTPVRDMSHQGIGMLVEEFSGLRLLDYLKIDGGRYESASDEGLRFRRAKDSKNLVVVHNLSENNLRKVLEVGGLIMPSIAITDVNMGHSGYGEISLLFDKDTINPSDRRNKVYGGDAWTPRFPRMVPKLNGEVLKSIRNKIYNLLDEKLQSFYSLSAELYPTNMESAIADRGIDSFYGKEWMKIAYLLDNGKKFKVPMKMKDYGTMAEPIIKLAKERGLSLSDIHNEGYEFYKNNPDFVEAVQELKIEQRLSSVAEEEREKVRELLKQRPTGFNAFDTYISKALSMENDLNNGGLKQVIDSMALYDAINKKVKTDNADYNKWVNNLFDGVVEKYGIRNNRDWYTPSGNSRPWEQLYDPATPANILRHMLAENEQGGSGGLWNSNIMGASAETYESIDVIREKGKKRLHKVSAEEYDVWTNSVSDRFAEICDEFMTDAQKNDFGGIIDAKIAITNAVAKDKTAKGIYKIMSKEYPKFTMEHAKRVEEIVKEIQDYATTYFEAKPQRIVELSEVRKAIVPSDVSSDILEGLEKNGIDVATYRKGNEQSRARLIKKESEGLRFRAANRNQVGFVSNAMKAVEGIKQEKATPQQWLAMIEKQGGLKAGEDKWLGLSDWLKSSDKKTLTKDEVLDFIGENMIRIEEVKYGEGMPKHAQEKLDELNAEFNEQIYLGEEETDSIYTSDWVDYAWSVMVDRYGDDFESAFRIEGGGTNAELVPMLEYDDEMTDQAKYFLEINDSTNKSINSTRLDYTTEGLENKREIALTVPTIESWNEHDDIHFGDAGDGRAVAWIRFGEATTYENVDDVQQVTDFHEPYKDVNGLDIYKPIGSFRNGDFIAHGKGRNGDMIYVVYINGNQVPVSYKTLDDARVGMNEYYKEHPRKLRKPLRVLVIDEIQSKRHQEGREKGYKNVYGDQLREINKQLVDVEAKISIGDATPEVIARRESLLDERRSILASVNPEVNKIEDEIRAKESRSKELLREMGQNEENELVEVEKLRILQDGVRRVDEYDNLEKEIKSIRERIENRKREYKRLLQEIDELDITYDRLFSESVYELSSGIPSAPFEKNWHELAMKRMLRLAAEEGFDKVAWTTGAQQAERYNIGTMVRDIEVRPVTDAETGEVLDAEFDVYTHSNSGNYISEATGRMNTEQIMEVFGKDLGGRIIEGGRTQSHTVISGKGLNIGGDGMNGFYDRMLPSFVNKYVKKWGTKVGEVELPELEESAQKMWSVDVTEQMKAEVDEQVMFSRKPIGGNSGYVGYSMSKRAETAREEGRYPKTDFKKEYGITDKTLDALVELGIVNNSEWHHTSSYGNRTTFYGWAEPWYAEYYADHKAEIDKSVRALSKEPKMEDYPLTQEGMDAFSREMDMYRSWRRNLLQDVSDEFESGREAWEAEERAKKERMQTAWEERLVYNKFVDESLNVPEEYKAKNGVRVVTHGKNTPYEWEFYWGENPAFKKYANIAREELESALKEQKRSLLSFEEWKELKATNDRFNEELQMQIDGTLPVGHIYQLGMPGKILLSCGFPNMPIELSSTNLAEHARKTHHPFELEDVKGIVKAMHEPIAVFSYGDKEKSQNVIVEIQKDGRNFLVGVHFNQTRNGLEVSSIRGIFPKDNAEWLNWITQGKSLYLNKEKIQDLINQQRKNLADVKYLDLDSIANVIESFENPSVAEEKVLFSAKEDVPELMPGEDISDYLERIKAWRKQKSREDFMRNEHPLRDLLLVVDEYEKRLKEQRSKISLLTKKIQNYTERLTKEERRNLELTEGDKAYDYKEIRSEIEKFIRQQISSDVVSFLNKTDLNGLLRQMRSTRRMDELENILLNVQIIATQAEIRKSSVVLNKLLSLKVQGRNGKNMSVARLVDDSTRKIFAYMRSTVLNMEVSGYEDDIKNLRAKAKENAENLAEKEKELLSSTDRKEQILEEISSLKEEAAKYEEEIMRLKSMVETVKTAKAEQTDTDIDEELAAMEERYQEKVASGTWTHDDELRLTALNLMQMIAVNKKENSAMKSLKASIDEEYNALNADVKAEEKYGYRGNRQDLHDRIDSRWARLKAMKMQQVVNLDNQLLSLRHTVDEMRRMIEGGKNTLAKRRQAETERMKEILRNGVISIRGKHVNIMSDEMRGRKGLRGAWDKVEDAITLPLGSFEFMAKLVSKDGENGWLYKYFIQGENGVLAAYDTYIKGMKAAKTRMNNAVERIFGKGKDIADVMVESDKVIESSGVYKRNNGEIGDIAVDAEIEIPLSRGQAMYIYMVWKMDDGRAKLIAQGFSENSITQIKAFIGKKYVAYADWIQDIFLPELREKYNDKYLAIYDTSLAEVEHYVPLRIRKESVYKESDLSADKQARKTLEQRAGSLINRVANINPVDINVNGFAVIADHVNQMEQWNAYARVRKDLDYLLSNNYFINQMNTNRPGSFERFYEAAAVATESFTADPAKYGDKLWKKLSKGVVSGNIAYRLNTALKQLLSLPAFLGFSQSPRFMAILGKRMGTIKDNIKWGMVNLPSFRERVERGKLGDEKLDEKGFNKMMDKYTEIGMIPNKWVDAMACAIGARSIYEYRLKQMTDPLKKQSLDAEAYRKAVEEAHRLALRDADIYYNATQQSSHPAFLSPMQLSRTFVDCMLTTYQNSNIGYVRQTFMAFLDMKRRLNYDDFVKQRRQSYISDGMATEEALKQAKADWWSENRKSLSRFLIFGWGLNLLWDLGSQGLLGFMDGDDDDKSAFEIIGFICTSPLKGVPMGNMIGGWVSGYGYSPFLVFDEINEMVRDVKLAVERNGPLDPVLYYETLGRVGKVAGVDLEVWSNIYMGVEDMIRQGKDLDAGRMTMDLMFVLNSPKKARSQVAKYLYRDKSPVEFAEALMRARKYVSEDNNWERWVPGVNPVNRQEIGRAMKEYDRLNGMVTEKTVVAEGTELTGTKLYNSKARLEDFTADHAVNNYYNRLKGVVDGLQGEFDVISATDADAVEAFRNNHQDVLKQYQMATELRSVMNKAKRLLGTPWDNGKVNDDELLRIIRNVRKELLDVLEDD